MREYYVPDTKTVASYNLHNIVVGFINIVLPESRQIPLQTETVSFHRKMTPRELDERVLRFFDEPGVVR